MITLFQITGSSSFAVRAALECAGAEYEVVDVHPSRRDDAAGFADANPLKRVPALREGDVRISETGAILLWLGDRFPDAHLAPAVGTPARADHYRWVTWCANTLHVGWWPSWEVALDQLVHVSGLVKRDGSIVVVAHLHAKQINHGALILDVPVALECGHELGVEGLVVESLALLPLVQGHEHI
ncbi:MAG: glutathione S-transferase family protein, partial [Miltoncostaeaceae bacterium]